VAHVVLDGEPDDRDVAAALASYRAGAVPFVTVLEAQSRLYLDRATMVRNVAEHEGIRAGLEAASISGDGGVFPVSADSSRDGASGMGSMRCGEIPMRKTAFLLLAAGSTIAAILVPACRSDESLRPSTEKAPIRYECRMHPSYIFDRAGSCPSAE
jgi:hypothetical protein